MKVLENVAVVLVWAIAITVSIPASAAGTPSKRVSNLQTLYSYLVYPNNLQVFSDLGLVSPVDSLFSSSGVHGRIAPLGVGQDLAYVKKYFFGLSPDGIQQTSTRITAVTFRSITEDAPSVNVEVDITFSPVGAPSFQLRETGRFTFDKMNRISSFDLSIPYYDSFMSIAGLDISDPSVQSLLVSGVCSTHEQYCSGANRQYASYADCVNTLFAKPKGNWNRVNSDSLVCRKFHEPFVRFTPEVGCPVIGPTGSNVCVDQPYAAYFDETF